VDGAVVSDHAAMAEATFTHFEGLLGTSEHRLHSLDLDFLGTYSKELSELEAAFSEEEIWEVVRHARQVKRQGPRDSRPRSCKSVGVVKGDFRAALDKLFTMCGRKFQGLDQALMILLAKRLDAAALGDYWSISLIHIFTKLVAKTLASRLDSRMESLVDRNHCTFIRKRCIHDNFILV
jgi:hypothetical protein